MQQASIAKVSRLVNILTRPGLSGDAAWGCRHGAGDGQQIQEFPSVQVLLPLVDGWQAIGGRGFSRHLIHVRLAPVPTLIAVWLFSGHQLLRPSFSAPPVAWPRRSMGPSATIRHQHQRQLAAVLRSRSATRHKCHDCVPVAARLSHWWHCFRLFSGFPVIISITSSPLLM